MVKTMQRNYWNSKLETEDRGFDFKRNCVVHQWVSQTLQVKGQKVNKGN